MYKLKLIKSKETWNNFITKNNFNFYSFLSSWEWYSLQELSGKQVYKFGIYESPAKDKGVTTKKLIGILPLIKNEAKRGTYLFAPHTPLILENKDFFEVLSSILDEIKMFGKKHGARFIRFNSPVKNLKINKISFKKLGFLNAPMHEHAEDTHLLDLSINEEDLLKNIKKKDRYYINRAIKEGVEVIKGNTSKNIEILSSMHLEHSKKVGYHPFSRDFINKLYQVFGDNITTILTRYDSVVESALMTIRFGKICVYYIAASDIKHPKFSPNYLCQWEAIKQAKLDGCEIYNFWGVSPDNNPAHPIAGVSKFKRKFAGYDYSLLHAQDLPLSPLYWFNYLIESIRRKKRGYYYKKPE